MNKREELILSALEVFAEAVEGAAFTLKRTLREELGGVNGFKWEIKSIKWTKHEGEKGEYERSEDVNNLEFKALLKYLASRGGKLRHDKWFFWIFRNGSTVARKWLGSPNVRKEVHRKF